MDRAARKRTGNPPSLLWLTLTVLVVTEYLCCIELSQLEMDAKLWVVHKGGLQNDLIGPSLSLSAFGLTLPFADVPALKPIKHKHCE